MLRNNEAGHARARSTGVFIYPVFVLDDDICALGTPSLDRLVQRLK